MRLFIGVAVPNSYVDLIGCIEDTWRPRLNSCLSWVRPENVHLTLKFLGEVVREKIPLVRTAMGQVEAKPFIIQAGKGGSFPNTRVPRVLWVGLTQGEVQCGYIFNQLDQALALAGFAPETRPFRAHLTIARVKKSAPGDDWAGFLRDLSGSWPEFVVERLVLWQSRLSASGPCYEVVKEVRLGNRLNLT